MTIALKDYRRTDPRKQTLENPYWLTSEIFGPEADDLGALLFSFPTKMVPDNLDPYGTYAPASELGTWGKWWFIEDAAVEIVTAFVGGTVALGVSVGTIPTDNVVDGGTITITGANAIIATAQALPLVAGMKLTNAVLRTLVTCADTTTPCIFAALTSDAAITAGKARLHLKLSRIGGVPRA